MTINAMAMTGAFGRPPASVDGFDLSGSDTHLASNGSVYPGYFNANGRTQVSADLVGGQKTLTIIVLGQSNACAVGPTPYTPTSPLVHNLNIYDGCVYRMRDNPLGCSQTPVGANQAPAGTWLGRLGDKLIAGGKAARVIMVPAAMAGTFVIDHDPAVSPINHFQKLVVALRRCSALGIPVDAVIWMQGEGDNVFGTPAANYTASLARIIAQSRVIGYTGPWFINKTTWNAGAPSAPIQGAQAAVINHATGVWEGANTDAYDNSYRQDLCHFTDSGMDTVATAIVAALALYGAPFV